jgi:hypothetical protein
VGEPADLAPLLRQREPTWTYGPGPDGQELTLDDEATLPAVDLEDLLAGLRRQRAYIEALKAAGRWRR